MHIEKLRAAIQHVVANCPADRLGAVKLHKVLYYADMLSFIDTGTPLTGAGYRKRPFGPTCDAALRVVSALQREGSLEVRDVEYFGYRKREFHPVGAFNTNVLSAREKDLLGRMIEFVCFDNSAKSISELSHDLPWQMVEMGEIIPYHSALHLVPSVPSEDTLEWAQEEGRRIVDQGLGAPATTGLGGSSAADIRGRMVAYMGSA